MSSVLQHLWRDLLDVVFPRSCVHCAGLVEGGRFRHLCVRCEKLLHIVQAPHCTTCGHPYFGELLKRNVSFYDTKRNVKHIAKSKPKPPSGALLELLAKWSKTVTPQLDGIALQWPDVQLPAGLGPYWDHGDFY